MIEMSTKEKIKVMNLTLRMQQKSIAAIKEKVIMLDAVVTTLAHSINTLNEELNRLSAEIKELKNHGA